MWVGDCLEGGNYGITEKVRSKVCPPFISINIVSHFSLPPLALGMESTFPKDLAYLVKWCIPNLKMGNGCLKLTHNVWHTPGRINNFKLIQKTITIISWQIFCKNSGNVSLHSILLFASLCTSVKCHPKKNKNRLIATLHCHFQSLNFYSSLMSSVVA